MFETQVAEIQRAYDLQPGGVDLACFALFGLFNSAMGVTTVFPDMDFSRPASADPRKLLAAANDWQRDAGVRLAGGVGQAQPPLRAHRRADPHAPQSLLLRRPRAAPTCCAARWHASHARRRDAHAVRRHRGAAGVDDRSPRGARRNGRADRRKGAGVCVGRKFDSIEWRVIRITDEPIAIDRRRRGTARRRNRRADRPRPAGVARVRDLPAPSPCGEGWGGGSTHGDPQSPTRSLTLPVEGREPEDSDTCQRARQDPRWRRRLASHGRRRLPRRPGPLLVLRPQVAARRNRARAVVSRSASRRVFNAHPRVKRSALVGVGPVGDAKPVLIVELTDDDPARSTAQPDERARRRAASSSQGAAHLARKPSAAPRRASTHVLVHPSLPVDVRHNAKINREAARGLGGAHDRRPRADDPARWTIACSLPPTSSLQPPALPPMHALVTGGGGFLGRYIVEQLLARGDRVRSFGRGAYPELEAMGVEVVRGDIADRRRRRRARARASTACSTPRRAGHRRRMRRLTSAPTSAARRWSF